MTRTDAPGLSNSDIVALTEWRRMLHRHPELSGHEAETAARVVGMLQDTRPDGIVTGLGGHGVAATFDSGTPGPHVMLRCELDALPIEELGDVPHKSTVPGVAHLCGHDGHMTLLAGMARLLGRQRPARGMVTLMFQPAEEDGAGAARVVADPRFAGLKPTHAFAIHNMPGFPLGHVTLGDGPVMCASRGMRVVLTGRTAHASEPEKGTSPMQALAALMPGLAALGQGRPETDPDFALATICHARLGDPAFGVAPGLADLFVTLRSLRDDRMQRLIADAEAMVQAAARENGLAATITYEDVFVTTENTAGAVKLARAALDRIGISHDDTGLPLRASEDFGRFGGDCELAMLFLGSGTDHPAVHNPDFDFPDDLIPIGTRIFAAIVDEVIRDDG
ncbi:amidohydrolase [Lutimaribacter pacificus]|uniref:Amidohydrolase n=1 Tax=Lutimaribacter pacificus TaxID=391948 RepID=A0A1H0IE61_9RHOB|nr:amidohydrolase [Lutimaribacter pacificus]SDO29683.1 amidohydrolase [Lutimaribacter pacificus]SHK23026.1 amidohydrolase [Lutimaribacter pacificus]